MCKKWMTTHAFDSPKLILIGLRRRSFEFTILKNRKRMKPKKKKNNFQNIAAKALASAHISYNNVEWLWEEKDNDDGAINFRSLSFLQSTLIFWMVLSCFYCTICNGWTQSDVELNTKSRWANVDSHKETQISITTIKKDEDTKNNRENIEL